MVNYRLKAGHKKVQKINIFLKKKCLFRHFSVSFVIFNIKVKELEDRKISPIYKSILVEII